MERRLLYSCVLILLCSVATASAVETADRWGAGIEGGYMKMVEGHWDYSNVDQFVGLHLSRGLSPTWTADLTFRYGYNRPGVAAADRSAGWTLDAKGPFFTELIRQSVELRYNLRPDRQFNPFLGTGIGWTKWHCKHVTSHQSSLFPDGRTPTGFDTDGNRVPLEGDSVTLTLAIGCTIDIADNKTVNLGGRYHILPGNKVDTVGWSHLWNDAGYVDANKGVVEGFLGISMWFGNLDRDGDRIANKFDACPDAAEDFDGFEDQDGCPDADNDQDGINDTVDLCPDEPEDRDGFEDTDGCPEADNDGDGVYDGQDLCPDEAEDFDGFEDADGCPELDNDADGVADSVDQCPGTPLDIEVDETGCPVVEEIQQNLVLEGVAFLSGSAQLTPESVAVITRIAESLRAWPDVRVEVRGHTDALGTAEANRALSQRRAMAVRDALIQIGIAPMRISAVGYGEDYPIADNTTAEGRARNRRVELHRID